MGVSGTSVDGRVEDASFIVSGLGKAGKLAYNARPYGYYYRTVMDVLPRVDQLLVLGYGWRDVHVNTWLNEYASLHPERRSAVVTVHNAWDYRNNSPQNQALPRLAGSPWQKIEISYAVQNPGESVPLLIEGSFAIAPSGFIMKDSDEATLLEFLLTNAAVTP